MSRRPALTLVETLVVIAIIGVLVGLLLSAVQKVRGRAAEVRCQNHLRQLGLAAQNYHAAHNRLPPGVTPNAAPETVGFLGWQARLLPFLEKDAVWRQATAAAKVEPVDFTKPPHPFATVVPAFTCPADGRTQQPARARDRLTVALGSYLGSAGTRHARRDGLLFADSAVKLTDVADGTSNTLLAGERPPTPDMWIGW
ncbi:MAG: DUF1559 domain-containing protein, partial [Gemmataceae bacterium]|nr:DUF1559 domain-containing protein [Gemmataceae bacterium]